MFETQTIPAATAPAARHASRAQERLALLKSRIAEVTPADALAMQAHGAALIDVRDPDEIAQGTAAGAIRLGRSFLELRIEEAVDVGRTVIVMCGSGVRSLFAADELARLGYADVHSLAGGFTRWKHEGLPIEMPPVLDAGARLRYSRHLLIPEIGEAGQAKLTRSKVLLVGAGGLGSPAAYYLAAAGIGTLGLVDDDVVERSNLQRQILHTDARVGVPKVVSARLALEALNPGVKVVGHEERLTSANIERILVGLRGRRGWLGQLRDPLSGERRLRQAGAAECARRSHRFDGQVAVFWPAHPTRPGPAIAACFASRRRPASRRRAPRPACSGSCLASLDLLQATETIKLLLGLGEPLVGRVLHFDALRASFRQLRLERDPAARVAATVARSRAMWTTSVLRRPECVTTP